MNNNAPLKKNLLNTKKKDVEANQNTRNKPRNEKKGNHKKYTNN